MSLQKRRALNKTAQDAELVARFVAENLLDDYSAILKMIRKNARPGMKIKSWFDGVLAKMTGSKNLRERVYIEKMRTLYANALALTPQMQTSFSEEPGADAAAAAALKESHDSGEIDYITYDGLTDELSDEENGGEDIMQKTMDYVFNDVVDINPTSFKIREESSLTTASGIDTVNDIQEDSPENSISNPAPPIKQYNITPSEKGTEETLPLGYSYIWENYAAPITQNDINTLRSIPRKSINAFTSEDIRKTQKWAYKFYQQLGTKSPFFRAWFGDWRASDMTPIAVSAIPAYSKETAKQQRGVVKCKDSSFDIEVQAG